MTTVYLSAGSNLGDRIENLRRALRALSGRGIEIRRVSSCYETEPVGAPPQPWYVNVAVEADTELAPHDLLARIEAIEHDLGRSRPFANAPRTIDLDILLYGARVITEPDLVVPHARMTERRFVLEPLAEIAPGVVHPLECRTISELLASCPDRGRVRRLDDGDLA